MSSEQVPRNSTTDESQPSTTPEIERSIVPDNVDLKNQGLVIITSLVYIKNANHSYAIQLTIFKPYLKITFLPCIYIIYWCA